ncbi:MAG: 50S ribosomal protein L24 [Patescibacteria group bacterium]|nr:50S ribosomal protein L24 [Patescibacteria group bacterium]
MNTLHIKKGDTVRVRTGRDKGKTGKVIKALPKENQVIVEGINVYKKHVRPRTQQEKGQTVMVPRPISVANVGSVERNSKRKSA